MMNVFVQTCHCRPHPDEDKTRPKAKIISNQVSIYTVQFLTLLPLLYKAITSQHQCCE